MEPTGANPHGLATGRSNPIVVQRLFVDRALTLVAIALMLYGAFYPVFGHLPGQGFRTLTIIAVGTTIVGGLIVPRGSRLAFTVLWAAFGMAAALWQIGLFGVVGFFNMAAGILLVGAIAATPNRSGLASRFDWHFVVAFAIAYSSMFSTLFL